MEYTLERGYEDCDLYKAHQGDAGLDLKAKEDTVLFVGQRLLVPTALRVAVPQGWVGLVCPRSGLALKHGVTVLNAPGVIDSGYRGDLNVLLMNHGDEPFHIKRGDRIAQLVLTVFSTPPLHRVGQFNDATERGEAGFGSSGISKIVH